MPRDPGERWPHERPDEVFHDFAPARLPGGSAERPAADPDPVMPRFCRRCGTAWDPAWHHCPICNPPHTVADAPESEEASGEPSAIERPSIKSALALYFVFLGSLLVMYLTIHFGAADPFRVMVLVEVIDAVLVVFWSLAAGRDVLGGLAVFPNPAWLVAAVGLAGLTFGMALLALAMVKALAGDLPIDPEVSEPLRDAGYGWGAIILIICVQPAVIEELAFRGVILSGLRQVLGTHEAVVVNAFLFTLIHLTIPQFAPHILLVGLVTGYLRVHTGSLYPCMVLHFTHNLLVVLTESWFN